MAALDKILKLISGGAALVAIASFFRSDEEPGQTTVLVGFHPPTDQPQAPDGYERYSGPLDTVIVEQAKAALAQPFGAWIPFTHPTRGEMGVLLEWHYHDPGGPLRPWGWHKGASVFQRRGVAA
ncbi:MAG TPA: hypothetical protein VF420_13200 [Casimicrobiaceae bacterium]